MAKSPKSTRTCRTWRSLENPDARKREQWAAAEQLTQWAVCGVEWDAVAILPLALGLEALDGMRLPRRRGHPVLADRLTGVLYVMVPPGTGTACEGLPGVRVLARGHQLLLPCGDDTSPATDWLSAPRENPPVCVPADRLAYQLEALTRAPVSEQQAAAS